jgi:ribosomal protein S18 acetylase RimI-like enzyme
MPGHSTKPPRPKPPLDPAKLARVSAGRHATGDGRFVVEQSSGGWMLTDTERANELGLPLVRGPFVTLDAAREALADLRSGPAPVSNLADRIAALPKRAPGARAPSPAGPAVRPATPTEPAPVVVREFRSRDGEGLRALWEAVGFRSLGDDDMSLRRFAQRNPGLLLVAAQGTAVVGSAMGGWDGRRGWIYHVATAAEHRRTGLARRLVRQVEDGLRALGCPKVNVLVGEANAGGAAFWLSIGYVATGSRQYGRELPREPGGR